MLAASAHAGHPSSPKGGPVIDPSGCRGIVGSSKIRSPHVGDLHGGRIRVTMEGITVYLELIACESEMRRRKETASLKYNVQPWTVLCYIPTH
eukprot:8402592-Pyramimonas_sp.AAC.1